MVALANTTTASDLIDPVVWADYIAAQLPHNIHLRPLAQVNTKLQGTAGSTITVPSYSYMGDAVPLAELADVPLRKLGVNTQEVPVAKIANGFALSDEAIVAVSRASAEAGADFVKTSTGFHPSGGASPHAVELMAGTVDGHLGGGICRRACVLDVTVRVGLRLCCAQIVFGVREGAGHGCGHGNGRYGERCSGVHHQRQLRSQAIARRFSAGYAAVRLGSPSARTRLHAGRGGLLPAGDGLSTACLVLPA